VIICLFLTGPIKAGQIFVLELDEDSGKMIY